jgi:hypothetical protein
MYVHKLVPLNALFLSLRGIAHLQSSGNETSGNGSNGHASLTGSTASGGGGGILLVSIILAVVGAAVIGVGGRVISLLGVIVVGGLGGAAEEGRDGRVGGAELDNVAGLGAELGADAEERLDLLLVVAEPGDDLGGVGAVLLAQGSGSAELARVGVGLGVLHLLGDDLRGRGGDGADDIEDGGLALGGDVGDRVGGLAGSEGVDITLEERVAHVEGGEGRAREGDEDERGVHLE